MARGNQRDQSRAKNQDKLAKVKSKNTRTGSEHARAMEDAAAIMREKQKKADEKRAAEGPVKKK